MSDVNVTLIFPAASLEAATSIMPGINTGLSADGSLPATHYVSSGWIPEELVTQLEPLTSATGTGDGINVITTAGLKLCYGL